MKVFFSLITVLAWAIKQVFSLVKFVGNKALVHRQARACLKAL